MEDKPKSTYDEHLPICSICGDYQLEYGLGITLKADNEFYPLCRPCADFVDDHMYRVIGPDRAKREEWFAKQIAKDSKDA
jgi:hypothetical protein